MNHLAPKIRPDSPLAFDPPRGSSGTAFNDLKLVDFALNLSEAHTVQLAADFTDWEEYPISMVRFDDGVWHTMVPLPPGIYTYRFLVDGKWYDDPRALWKTQESAGPARALIQVK